MRLSYLFILCVLFFSLLAQESQETKQPQPLLHLSLSLGLTSGIHVGKGNIINKKNVTIERLINLHYEALPYDNFNDCQVVGLYFSNYYFKNPRREGFFWYNIFGIDAVRIPGFNIDPGGSSGDSSPNNFIAPNLCAGFGYSKRSGETSTMRYSLDAGIKAFLISLKITYTF